MPPEGFYFWELPTSAQCSAILLHVYRDCSLTLERVINFINMTVKHNNNVLIFRWFIPFV